MSSERSKEPINFTGKEWIVFLIVGIVDSLTGGLFPIFLATNTAETPRIYHQRKRCIGPLLNKKPLLISDASESTR